jgi:sulfur-oxidizing protein SoxZ
MAKKTIRIRANITGGVTEVKTLINHPMETGLRKDKKTGKKIPAHFIKEVNCEHKGKTVMLAQWGVAISKNPYLAFKFKGAAAGDKVKISWVDNKGDSDSRETTVK